MKPRRALRSGGFSLLEVVFAMGVLAFGLLTLALMQLYSLNQSSMGRHTGDAAAIGRSYLEQVHRLPWNALSSESGGGWTAPAWNAAPSTHKRVAGPHGVSTEQVYAVDWRVSAVAGTACLLDVELRVNWQEESVGNTKNLMLATRRYNNGGAGC